MTKQEFLMSLEDNLKLNQVHDIKEILSDYEKHFQHGLSKGKTEAEIAANLGSTTTIAKAYQTENMIKVVKNTNSKFSWSLALTVICRLLIIAPFNFIVLFVPGILLFTFLVIGWSFSAALGSASLALFATLPAVGALMTSAWLWLAGISAGFSLLGLAAIGGMIMFLLSKFILLGLISYLQWNLKFILEK